MTLKKAIEILQLSKVCEFKGDVVDLKLAYQWGIEALERLQDIRKYKTLMGLAISNPSRLLPSEAKEQEVQKR